MKEERTGVAIFLLACVLAALAIILQVSQLNKKTEVETFVWEETTYIIVTGPRGDVEIVPHFDPLP